MRAPRSTHDIYSDARRDGCGAGQLVAAAPALSFVASVGKACGCIRVSPRGWHMQWPPR